MWVDQLRSCRVSLLRETAGEARLYLSGEECVEK